MDMNFNSITLFWDWVFGTKIEIDEQDPVDFGITRDVDTGSFIDVHFGEFFRLGRDLKSASRFSDKIQYLFRAPGWSHTGDHQTVSVQKALR
jgi:hypothetical protein